MPALNTSTASYVELFTANVTANATSNPVRRDEFLNHAVFATFTDNTAGAVQLTVQVCARDPLAESDWVNVAAAAAAPFFLNLPSTPIYAIRVKRDNSTRPVSVLVRSHGSPRVF